MKPLRVALCLTALAVTACARTQPGPSEPPLVPVQSPSVLASPSAAPSSPPATTAPSPPPPSPRPSIRPSVTFWPDGAYGDPIGNLGAHLRLLTGTSPDAPPRLTVSPSTAAIASVRGSDWNLYFADLELLEPGGILVVAELGDARAHALAASVDPGFTSTPVPLPSGIPSALPERPTEARLIVDAADWASFIGDLDLDAATSDQPPVDLSRASLVAIVAPHGPRVTAPVVTHLVREPVATVHAVVPELEIRGSDPGQPGGIFLLAIPKVEAGARIELQTLAMRKG